MDIEHIVVEDEGKIVTLELDEGKPHGDPVETEKNLRFHVRLIEKVSFIGHVITITLKDGTSWLDIEDHVGARLALCFGHGIDFFDEPSLRAAG